MSAITLAASLELRRKRAELIPQAKWHGSREARARLIAATNAQLRLEVQQ